MSSARSASCLSITALRMHSSHTHAGWATRHPSGQVVVPQWAARNARWLPEMPGGWRAHPRNLSCLPLPTLLLLCRVGPHRWSRALVLAGLSHAMAKSSALPGGGWRTHRHPPHTPSIDSYLPLLHRQILPCVRLCANRALEL